MLGGVKVADGQVLHVVEHLVANLHEGALGHDGRYLTLDDLRGDGDRIDADERRHDGHNLLRRRVPVASLPMLVDDA